MKLSQVAFQAPQVTPAQRMSNPVKSAPKMALKTLDKDVFEKSPKKEFTNEDAMALMREELKDAMSKKELDAYMKNLDDACKQLEIEPKNLPINEEHPGNLTKDQRLQIFTLLKYDSLSELA
ncbi:MAG: hypothetical protein DKM24_03410 [Candidatus Melainabacteria bacterium]|nr:MAG: hypothetical protein DKM24_03410 [Candidatus Melainabacteria bacterium]